MKLEARPTQILRAVEGLPEARGSVREARVDLAAFRERLRKMSFDQIQHRFRAGRRALEILPHLAGDRDPEVVRRVLAISVVANRQLRWRTLAQLVPWFYADEAFRDVFAKRVKHDPPPRKAPRWLLFHFRALLEPRNAVSHLAQLLAIDEPAIARTLRKARLKSFTPLAEAVLLDLIERGDDTWLASQPYTLTLRWVERSPDSWKARRIVLYRVLDLATRGLGKLRHLDPGSPILELLRLAAFKLHGWPHQSREWQTMPPSATRVARWCLDEGLIRPTSEPSR